MAAPKLYRRLATGLAFAVFGGLGVFFQFLIFPGIVLVIRNKARRKILARRVIHLTFKWFIAFIRAIAILDWKAENLEKLQKPGQLILANHLTLIDVVFLFSFVPNACAIIKSGLAKNPFTWGAVYAAGYITNDSGPELIEDCVKELKSGASLIIFPEGTRTPQGQVPKLKHGAMITAFESDIDPTLLKITCEPLSLTKGAHWWDVPEKPMFFTFSVLGQLSVEPYRTLYKNSAPKAVRALSREIFGVLFPDFVNKQSEKGTDNV